MARRRRRTQDRLAGQNGTSATAYAERRRQSALSRAEAAGLDGDTIAREYALQEADHWLRVLNAAQRPEA